MEEVHVDVRDKVSRTLSRRLDLSTQRCIAACHPSFGVFAHLGDKGLQGDSWHPISTPEDDLLSDLGKRMKIATNRTSYFQIHGPVQAVHQQTHGLPNLAIMFRSFRCSATESIVSSDGDVNLPNVILPTVASGIDNVRRCY